jgi:hypothetical protein
MWKGDRYFPGPIIWGKSDINIISDINIRRAIKHLKFTITVVLCEWVD